MYHEKTPKDIRDQKRKIILFVAGALFVIVVCLLVSFRISTGLLKQGEVSLQDAILSSAKQCCAIEGSYPPSLEYLEQNYGLVVNREKYIITYSIFAENILPNVIVSAK